MSRAALSFLLLFAAASLSAQEAPPGTDLYSYGMAQRSRGDIQGAKKTFLRMLADDPKSGGAFEGLSVVSLSLKEYEQAYDYLSRWNADKPGSAYILGLKARADAALEKEEELLSDLRSAAAIDPRDLHTLRRLDDVLHRHRGIFPEARSYKSLVSEGLETGRPQRIVYEGRSAGVQARVFERPGFSLFSGYMAREEAQRNDTGAFTYFDVLEQSISLGASVRPRKGLDLEAEYAHSLLSDVKEAGVGRTSFSRMRMKGEWRRPEATYRLRAARAPYFLRGAGGTQYFSLLREASADGEVEASRWGLDFKLRGGLDDYSSQATLRQWSAQVAKEHGPNYGSIGYSQSHQEYSGAGPDGRIRFLAYDRLSARYRWSMEEQFRLDAGVGHSRFRDANYLTDSWFGTTVWMPKLPSLSLEYRLETYDFRSPVDGYRSTDSTEHWVGPHWKRMHARGFWTHLAAEHGFSRDPRGRGEGNMLLGELEWYWKDRISLLLQARGRRNTLHDDSYSLGLQGRWSF
ncbi:MAG: tetratricopeptide repeat protein [Elusimicrobiota bacterium]